MFYNTIKASNCILIEKNVKSPLDKESYNYEYILNLINYLRLNPVN